jgi:hypothetical protein
MTASDPYRPTTGQIDTAGRRSPPPLAAVRHQFVTLHASFGRVPSQILHMAAFVLASPLTSSDACLLFAEALAEAAREGFIGVQRETEALADHIAAQAPRFAGRAP